jgi:phage-related protein
MLHDIFKIVLISLPLVILAVTFLVALGKRPGYRRRHKDCSYNGPERRCDERDVCPLAEKCTKQAHECQIHLMHVAKRRPE